MDYDHAYKLLFSHPQMVADLLRGFVQEAWVQQLDFTTLEPGAERVGGPSLSGCGGCCYPTDYQG
jgi:hypothetical protein